MLNTGLMKVWQRIYRAIKTAKIDIFNAHILSLFYALCTRMSTYYTVNPAASFQENSLALVAPN